MSDTYIYSWNSGALLEQHTASNSASLDFTTAITATYDAYVIELINLIPAVTGSPVIEMSTDGGSNYDTTSGHYKWQLFEMYTGATGNSYPTGSDSAAYILLSPGPTNTSSYGVCGTVKLFNPGSASLYKLVTFQFTCQDGNHATNLAVGTGGGAFVVTTAVNAFRVRFPSGNITSGTVRVYGVG